LERETLEMDVVFVGAGPANLSGALHLANLIKTHNEEVASGKRAGAALGEVEIGVIEKGATVPSDELGFSMSIIADCRRDDISADSPSPLGLC